MTSPLTTHPMTRLVRGLVASVAALVLPLSLSSFAVAGDEESSPESWTIQVGSESPDQAIQGMSFLPSNIYINTGDTITWEANSAEIHTVTFLARGQKLQPFNPFNPKQLSRQGSSAYDGHSYYNSGIMANVSNTGFKAVEDYALKFTHTGTFTYYCVVHGTAMKGTVHVRAAGTDYPYSQDQYDHQTRKQERKIVRDGEEQWEAARDQASNHQVIAGTDNETAMLMRFVHHEIVVHVGDTVTFRNAGMGAPHTVTFGHEPANIFAPVGNPKNFTGGNLSSGLMEPGTKFTVTFNKAGEFAYICALHDYMGMIGEVEVRS
ncbi:plastocyanin/azurin family copper-binding protein [Arthrobacter globiformis]|uniref:plastocyanin/azurin family copper-binding protein n=1 Tax=Arthrobacter globiformis TaxID=1665 RepID=UPI002788511F|nr:plastocyanin/azurin family copper-binding protein [Arthrobacter globiformis]MDQ0864508.1 plastocyanin [Arthrobacter globiformis]